MHTVASSGIGSRHWHLQASQFLHFRRCKMTVSSRQRCRPSGCDDELSHLPITYNSIVVVPNGKGECLFVSLCFVFARSIHKPSLGTPVSQLPILSFSLSSMGCSTNHLLDSGYSIPDTLPSFESGRTNAATSAASTTTTTTCRNARSAPITHSEPRRSVPDTSKRHRGWFGWVSARSISTFLQKQQ
jgi:hypothetical protein